MCSDKYVGSDAHGHSEFAVEGVVCGGVNKICVTTFSSCSGA